MKLSFDLTSAGAVHLLLVYPINPTPRGLHSVMEDLRVFCEFRGVRADQDGATLEYSFRVTTASVKWAIVQANVDSSDIVGWFNDMRAPDNVKEAISNMVCAATSTAAAAACDASDELFVLRQFADTPAGPQVNYKLLMPPLWQDRSQLVKGGFIEDAANAPALSHLGAEGGDLAGQEARLRAWKSTVVHSALSTSTSSTSLFFNDAMVLNAADAIDEMAFCPRGKAAKMPHFYQRDAADRVILRNVRSAPECSLARSGIIIAPCGSGKTLIGVMVMSRIRRPTVIFCATQLAVSHWKSELLAHTELSAKTHVFCMTSRNNKLRSPEGWSKMAEEPDADPVLKQFQGPVVIITTYAMFATTTGGGGGGGGVGSSGTTEPKQAAQFRSGATLEWMKYCQAQSWGLVILDEVHQAPAEAFSRVATGFRAQVKLGLTATLVREDDKVGDLQYLVGPVIYELDTPLLQDLGHVARVNCVEVECTEVPASLPPPPQQPPATSHLQQREFQRMLAIMNPDKVRVCAVIVACHIAQGDKCIIYCDNLAALEQYKDMVRCPAVQGSTPHRERETIIRNFREARGGACILFSSVGDQSIDIPQANVAVQLSVLDGSRMQELQRVGRVQRISTGKRVAWFYSLVTLGSDEVAFATRRRSYLHSHGYRTETVPGSAFAHKEVDALFESFGSADSLQQAFWKYLYDKSEAMQTSGAATATESVKRSLHNDSQLLPPPPPSSSSSTSFTDMSTNPKRRQRTTTAADSEQPVAKRVKLSVPANAAAPAGATPLMKKLLKALRKK